jgi:hypothetical protein
VWGFDCLFGISSIAKSHALLDSFCIFCFFSLASHDEHCSRPWTGPTRIHAYTCTCVHLSTCRHSLTSKAAHPITSHSLTITYTFVLCRTPSSNTRYNATYANAYRCGVRIHHYHVLIQRLSVRFRIVSTAGISKTSIANIVDLQLRHPYQ